MRTIKWTELNIVVDDSLTELINNTKKLVIYFPRINFSLPCFVKNSLLIIDISIFYKFNVTYTMYVFITSSKFFR